MHKFTDITVIRFYIIKESGTVYMKVVVIGDALVKSEDLDKAAHQMNFNEPIDIQRFEWFSDLSKDEFQQKILSIEQSGPENVRLPNGLLDALTDADVILVHLAPVSEKMIAVASHLRLIGACRGGVENVNVDVATKRKIPIIHVIRNAEPVADFTLGLIIAETRNIARAHCSIMRGVWQKSFANDPYKTTLKNLKVGLVGAGYIGRLVLKRLACLGIETAVYDPYVKPEDLAEDNLHPEFLGLKELFSTCDVISLHMRVSPQTSNMVNKSVLSLMKPSAYLINTSRAEIINRDDLVNVLTKRKIAGAAIDVFWQEPLTRDDAFLKLDNVTLTTHIAGDTVDAISRAPYLLKDVMNDYFAKKKSKMQINHF